MPRDKDVLRFLARFRWATVGQLGAAFDMDPRAVRRSILRRLGSQGLISVHSAAKANIRGNVVSIAPPGAKCIWLDRRDCPKGPPTNHLAHYLALTDLGISREQQGERVLSEWQIRRASNFGGKRIFSNDLLLERLGIPDPMAGRDTLDQKDYSIKSSQRGGHGLRVPDLVLVRPPAPNGSPMSVGVEVERSRKTDARYRELVADWHLRGRSTYAGVEVVILDSPDSEAIKKCLTEAVRLALAEDYFKISLFEPRTLAC